MKYKTYPQYKNSSLKWFDTIPKEWKIYKLKHIITSLESGKRKDFDKVSYALSLGGEHINWNGTLNLNNKRYLSKEYYDSMNKGKIKKNDVLIVKDGATIGKTAIIETLNQKMAVNEHVFIIRKNNRITAKMLYYLISSNLGFTQIKLTETGSAQPGINLNIADETYFTLPSNMDEQEQIAKYLDTKTTKIEKTITKNKKLITLLKEKRTSLINQAVTKGLNPEAPMKESGIEWIGKIPLNWSLKKINHLLYERREKNNPIKSKERLSLSIDKGVTLYSEKTTNLDRFKEDFTQYKLAYPGDLVLNSMNMIVGAVGVSNYFGCVSPVYYTYYDNTDENYTTRFCEYFFKLPTVKQYLKSIGKGIMSIERGNDRINTCRLKISRDDLKNIHVPIPPKEVQKEILSYLDYKTQKIDRTIEKIEKNIELLEEYKESLIHHVVTGKIDVRGVEI